MRSRRETDAAYQNEAEQRARQQKQKDGAAPADTASIRQTASACIRKHQQPADQVAHQGSILCRQAELKTTGWMPQISATNTPYRRVALMVLQHRVVDVELIGDQHVSGRMSDAEGRFGLQ